MLRFLFEIYQGSLKCYRIFILDKVNVYYFQLTFRSKTSTLCACCSHATLLLERFRTPHMGKICRKLLEPHTWPKIKVSIENSLVENVLHGDWRVNLTNQNIMHLFLSLTTREATKKVVFFRIFPRQGGYPLNGQNLLSSF